MALELTVVKLLEDPDEAGTVCIFVNEKHDLLSEAKYLCTNTLNLKVVTSPERHNKMGDILTAQGAPWDNLNLKVLGHSEGKYTGIQAVGMCSNEKFAKDSWKMKEQAAYLSLAVATICLSDQEVPDPCGTGLFGDLVAQTKLFGGRYAKEKKSGLKVTHHTPSSKDLKLSIGVKGDSLLCAKHDSKKKNKYMNFQEEFEAEFTKSVGDCHVDYNINIAGTIKDVIKTVNEGQAVDILIIGLGFNDLVVKNELVKTYPKSVDADLRQLAVAIKRKSNRALFLLGGSAEIWKYPERWDTFMDKARETLQFGEGIQVVPADKALEVMKEMPVCHDGVHLSGESTEAKELFAKAWSSWLLEYVDIATSHSNKRQKVA